MANFCSQCGSPVGSAAFCGKCGAPQPAAPSAPQPTPASQPIPTTPVKKGMGAGMKVALVFVALIIFVGGLAIAGVFYAVHRASQKFHEVTAGITGTGASGAAKAATSSGGDPC